MSYLVEKNGATSSTKPVSPSSYPGSSSRGTGFNSIADLERKDSVYKRRIRILRFISRLASMILSAFMVGSLSYSLARYFLTKNHIIEGNVHPWATPTTLWPTIMLLSISVLTFFMNLVTLVSYLCGVGAANKTSSVFSIIRYIMMAALLIAWAAAVGLFKMANNGKDLWGYSCGPAADEIQEKVQSFLNFGKLCTIQTGSWYMSIVETLTYGLTFVVTILMARRASHKKKLVRERNRLLTEREYTQNMQEFEMETTYEPGAGRRYLPVSVGSSHV